MSSLIITDSDKTPGIPAAALSLTQGIFLGFLGAVVGVFGPRARDGRGITTVEYVIGIIAGITIVGVLVLALTNPSVQNALMGLLKHLFGMGSDPTKAVKG